MCEYSLASHAAATASSPPTLSPLPPFPSVHAAAELPISAYMRYLQTTTQQQLWLPPPQTSVDQSPFMFLSLFLPFGCFSSPKSSYPLLSASLLFSPSTMAGLLGFNPSPRWKDLCNGKLLTRELWI